VPKKLIIIVLSFEFKERVVPERLPAAGHAADLRTQYRTDRSVYRDFGHSPAGHPHDTGIVRILNAKTIIRILNDLKRLRKFRQDKYAFVLRTTDQSVQINERKTFKRLTHPPLRMFFFF